MQYDLEQFVKEVEKSLLFTILSYMKHGKMTSADSQKLAQEFLKLIPPQDKDQFLQEFFELGRFHTQVLYVYRKYGDPYEEEKRVRKLLLIRSYFEQGDYDTAAEIAKGVKGGDYNG